jgi:outer membrane protein insertion porin family
MRLFGTYTNEYVTVTPNVPDQIDLFERFRSGTTSSLRFALQWDKRDNRLFPTKGWYEQVSVEVAPPFLAPSALFGSSVNLFTRYTLDVRGYYPLLPGVVARAKLGAGYIFGWDDQHRVPISELYYLGGINSIRGYRLLSLSPISRVTSTNASDSGLYDFYGGGNKQLTLNFEIENTISERLGLKGVVFLDMGNTFPQGAWSDPNVALSLYKSVGFGLRWLSPIGPLRFEWGFPLNRRYDVYTRTYIDSAADFQFTIGNFF